MSGHQPGTLYTLRESTRQSGRGLYNQVHHSALLVATTPSCSSLLVSKGDVGSLTGSATLSEGLPEECKCVDDHDTSNCSAASLPAQHIPQPNVSTPMQGSFLGASV